MVLGKIISRSSLRYLEIPWGFTKPGLVITCLWNGCSQILKGGLTGSLALSKSHLAVVRMSCVRAKLLSRVWFFVIPRTVTPSGSSVHCILQASILEWVAMPSSGGSSWPRVKPVFLVSPALAGGFFTTSITGGMSGGSEVKSCNGIQKGSR